MHLKTVLISCLIMVALSWVFNIDDKLFVQTQVYNRPYPLGMFGQVGSPSMNRNMYGMTNPYANRQNRMNPYLGGYGMGGMGGQRAYPGMGMTGASNMPMGMTARGYPGMGMAGRGYPGMGMMANQGMSMGNQGMGMAGQRYPMNMAGQNRYGYMQNGNYQQRQQSMNQYYPSSNYNRYNRTSSGSSNNNKNDYDY